MKITFCNSLNPKRLKSGQGMVEFALALPILLMLVLGIIAFGHLLFSYSLIVSASREAARFGVATGLSDRNIPRFRDCDAIIDAAVRVGNLAGVKPENVTISYDKGPKSDGSTPVVLPDGCPIGGIGPDIDIGNRVVVAIDVDYRPIVPLGLIPSIPISAVTNRTIIRTLPIDDAPVAPGSLCTGTITRVVPPNWTSGDVITTSRVGALVKFGAEVTADDPTVKAPGTLSIYIDDADYATPDCFVTTGGGVSTLSCGDTTWDTPGTHWIRAEYDPGTNATGTPCYVGSKAEPWQHVVQPADTIIAIFNADPKQPNSTYSNPVDVRVEVRTVSPGKGAPEGPVVIKQGDTVIGTITVHFIYGTPDVATGQGTFNLPTIGSHTLTAIYDPGSPGVNPAYNQSPPVTHDAFVDLVYKVPPADTIITIFKADPKQPNSDYTNPVEVYVEVKSVSAGRGAPEGPVVIMEGNTLVGTVTVNGISGAPDTATGTATFNLPTIGSHTLTAIYDPGNPGVNPDFNESPPFTLDPFVDLVPPKPLAP